MRPAVDEQRPSKHTRPTLACVLAAFVAACSAGGSTEPTRPNVLLISIDTLRADHLGCYGYERETSPQLDRLAQRGTVFERAFSTTSWTLPAHLSMLTGLPISAHGVCDDRLWTQATQMEDASVPLRGRFVSESLAAIGYRCAGFFTWKYLEAQFGFGPGFESWERLGHTFYSHPTVGPRFEALQQANDVDGMKQLIADHPELFDDTHPSSPEVIDASIAWLAEHDAQPKAEPFFLFVHLFDVHDPYVPPAPFDTRFDPDYGGPIDGRRVTSPDSAVTGTMEAADLQHLIALYDGEIAWVDHQLQRLFDELDRLALADDTLIIVTSDHGEEFFEHGHKTHRRQLYTESTHVPLIVVWPGRVPAASRVADPVGLIDIVPTLRAACGTLDETPVPGIDLTALARGELDAAQRSYLSELFVFGADGSLEQQLGVVRGDDHWVLRKNRGSDWRAEHFDLGSDFDELHALDSEVPAREIDTLREMLMKLRAAQPSRTAGLPALSTRDRHELEAMGYAGSDGQAAANPTEELCLDGCVWK